MRDMRAHDIDMLTIGQYLQPTAGAPAGAALRASRHVRACSSARRTRWASATPPSARWCARRITPTSRPKKCWRIAAPLKAARRSGAARPSRATAATSGRPAASGRPRRPASAPKPQKKSARTTPRIAPPVSCAITSRCSGVFDSGMRRGEEDRRAQRNRARVDGDRALRAAAARRACRSVRRSRASSEPGAGGGTSRKNT